eukprot:g3358.t1
MAASRFTARIGIDVLPNLDSSLINFSKVESDLDTALSIFEDKNIGDCTNISSCLIEKKRLLNRCKIRIIPTEFFPYLQRLYAHILRYPMRSPSPFIPAKSSSEDTAMTIQEGPEDDAILLEALASGVSSHIICHAPEGTYFPFEFSKPIFSVDITGGWLGSSPQLLSELAEIAPHIGIRLRLKDRRPGVLARSGGFDVGDETVKVLNQEAERIINSTLDLDQTKSNFLIERCIWFALYESARLSTEHNTPIVLYQTFEESKKKSK